MKNLKSTNYKNTKRKQLRKNPVNFLPYQSSKVIPPGPQKLKFGRNLKQKNLKLKNQNLQKNKQSFFLKKISNRNHKKLVQMKSNNVRKIRNINSIKSSVKFQSQFIKNQPTNNFSK